MIDVDTGAAPVRAAFTTRAGGTSAGGFASLNLGVTTGDDPHAVRVNREAIAGALGFDAARAASMSQVHGAEVISLGPEGGAGAFTGSLDGVAECDAAVTRAPGVALLAMGADCPVIVIWDVHGEVVAAVHAGWRGIVAGVIGAAVRATGAEPGALRAVVGPHVRPCCYPVDDSLRASLASAHGPDVVVGEAVDLGGACRSALAQAGLGRAGIRVEEHCTSCEAGRFYSYRRDGAATGRQAAVIWIEEPA